MQWVEQRGARIVFGWGREDLVALAPTSNAVVIVDVLRFTTAVSVAVSRNGTVFPYQWNDASASAHAAKHRAVLAGHRGDSALSLSPSDLARMPIGTRLVLPSPNGSALSFRASAYGVDVAAGCLRNAPAVGEWVARNVDAGKRVCVIAGGERWPASAGDDSHSGPLRPAVEDHYGAGAVIESALTVLGNEALASPEALAASAVFADARPSLIDRLRGCASGRELLQRGWGDDVSMAAEYGADTCVPIMHDGAFVAASTG